MSGHSKGDEPNAKKPDFKPSKDVVEKMGTPITREAFRRLVQRAANSASPTKKQT